MASAVDYIVAHIRIKKYSVWDRAALIVDFLCHECLAVSHNCRNLAVEDGFDLTSKSGRQLAGAYWGELSIPDSLRSGLARFDMLEHALAGILT